MRRLKGAYCDVKLNYPRHFVSSFRPGIGFHLDAPNQPLPTADAVEMALQILGIASLFGWRPSQEERRRLADVLLRERRETRQREVICRYDAGEITRAEAERLSDQAAEEGKAEIAKIAA